MKARRDDGFSAELRASPLLIPLDKAILLDLERQSLPPGSPVRWRDPT